MPTRPRPPQRAQPLVSDTVVSYQPFDMVAETQCIESDAVDDAQDSGKRTLNHKLSSSSLSMSLPPDSPPEIFDYPHGLLHAPDSSRTGTTAIPWTQISSRVKPRPSEHSSPCSRRRLSRAGQPSVASSTSCLDSATGIVPDLTRFDASTELDDDTQSKFSALRSAAPAGSAASTPGTLTYNPLTKDEVERLFASADTLIRTKDQGRWCEVSFVHNTEYSADRAL